MRRQPCRHFTTQFKGQTVAHLSEPDATQSSVTRELGVTSSQFKGWRRELAAAGSAEAIRRQQAEPAELAELRREDRQLKEDVEVMRKTSALFAQWALKQ